MCDSHLHVPNTAITIHVAKLHEITESESRNSQEYGRTL